MKGFIEVTIPSSLNCGDIEFKKISINIAKIKYIYPLISEEEIQDFLKESMPDIPKTIIYIDDKEFQVLETYIQIINKIKSAQ